MPSWNQLLNEFNAQPDDNARTVLLEERATEYVSQISALRGGTNVIAYVSAFLQKPQSPGANLMITHEDLNGLMTVMHGMDWTKGLTLVLHTPGGVMNAAESIVSYLRSKFSKIESIVPLYAMSAGTMISLGCDRILMGRQSQLGPIDAQLQLGSGQASARAIVEQFERAKLDIVGDGTAPGNVQAAHVWAPILSTMGPSLLQEAQNTLEYGESMVAGWLAKWMCAGCEGETPEEKGHRIAAHFNDASTHKSHGRRIDRDEARSHGVTIDDLEPNQDLQEAVLTLYHLLTISVEKSLATKIIRSSTGSSWIKSWSA